MKIAILSFIWIVSTLLAINVHAADIIQISADERGIPFFLDGAGHVWAFKDPVLPHGMKKLVQIPGLEKIKQIAPYIALDEQGRVFTWSLDLSELETVEDYIWHVGYVPAKPVVGLQGITHVAHANFHFFAVKQNREILRWEIKLDEQQKLAIVGMGPIKTLYSGKGIRKIAVAPGVEFPRYWKSLPSAIVALFEDGTVMGWGITKTGQITMEETSGVVLTQMPGAIDVAINAFHTAILTRQGEVKFWGGCDLFGRGDYIVKAWNPGNVSSANGPVTGVKNIVLAESPISGWSDYGNDNMYYDVFLKQDGTVWLAVAPIPENLQATDDCRGSGEPLLDQNAPRNMKIGTAPAIQAATGSNYLYILDAYHQVWGTQAKNIVRKLDQIKINIK